MRRKDRQISENEAYNILKNGEYGFVATVCEDGYPYAVPVNYVVEGDKIYFHGTPEGGLKAENIRKNPKVCFTSVGKTHLLPEKFITEYESAVVFGTAKQEEENKAHALLLLVEKYSPDFIKEGEKYISEWGGRTAVWAVTIEKITGKARRKKPNA